MLYNKKVLYGQKKFIFEWPVTLWITNASLGIFLPNELMVQLQIFTTSDCLQKSNVFDNNQKQNRSFLFLFFLYSFNLTVVWFRKSQDGFWLVFWWQGTETEALVNSVPVLDTGDFRTKRPFDARMRILKPDGKPRRY